jgi:hypothetical protein
MYKFDEINQLNNTLSDRDNQRDEKFNKFFKEALENVIKFNSGNTYNKIYLKKTVELLLEAIKIKNSSAEAYALLAYAMYILDENSLSLKYLKAGHSIDPNLPLIIRMQELLSNDTYVNSLRSTKTVNNSITEDTPAIKEKAKVSSIRRIKRL